MNLCTLASICTGTEQACLLVVLSVMFIFGLYLCED